MQTTRQNISVRDFLVDTTFITYVFDRDTSAIDAWKSRVCSDDKSREAFDKAKYILLHLDEETLLTDEEKRKLKKRICDTLKI